VLALIAWLVYDVTYIIDQRERGVVLRFGKHVDTLQPGASFRLPRPFETVEVANVDAVRSVKIGLNRRESYMLSQDQNIVDIQFNIQYRIKDLPAFLFRNDAPEQALSQAAESAVREIAGRNKMDFLIQKEGRAAVGGQARNLVQKILDDYGTGIIITQFNLQKSKEPEEVRAAFADAVKAEADEVRYKNQAETYRQEVLGRARGASQRALQDAQAYRARVIESSKGEADRFTKLLKEYEKAPEVTRERLYIETMESVLSNSTKIMTGSKGSGNNNLLYLPLDQLINQSRQAAGESQVWKPSEDSSSNQEAPAPAVDLRNKGGR
jgi:membrane protease subunit HflK